MAVLMSKDEMPEPPEPPDTQHLTDESPGQAPETNVPEQPLAVFLHVPLPEDVEHDWTTQHWLDALPEQYPDTEKPEHEEVDWQLPLPEGVEQVSRRVRRASGTAKAAAVTVEARVKKHEKCIVKMICD